MCPDLRAFEGYRELISICLIDGTTYFHLSRGYIQDSTKGAYIYHIEIPSHLSISKHQEIEPTLDAIIINLPSNVGQLATFAAYGIVAAVQGSGGLHVSQAITSLSLVNLLVTPLQYLLIAIPDTFASIGCLHRIQDFLRQPNRLGEPFGSSIYDLSKPEADPLFTEKRRIAQLPTSPVVSPSLSSIELSTFPSLITNARSNVNPVHLFLDNVRIGWKSSPADRSGVTLALRQSESGILVTIVGPLGSGKSIFLKGLAGETPVQCECVHRDTAE
ncbi:uncharacterized protein BO97DRAFT_178622 [Aspergillus homomorphus CBS 101889]|uniref:ABC transporter domain-containing protein n=1 Tax=Aspergillus homomorphus (strain CBS 101889) TaxID=1450537 RepID=A0A395I853_ASPHC|nr:hypothetical protein BO97DRAFT_178622 [Aspergillus homomorphus CBS 101889]RAL15989.1 hypothetical protein BO97DRAFT_178622 [Aspergillus homomorphus CBS 101889]